VARARGGCEDKGRWFALSERSVTAEPGDQGAGSVAVRIGVTDDSAFKRQVRARMAETGEKYTVARRMVIAEQAEAAKDAAVRGAVQRSIERAVGLSAVEVDFAADRVHVTIRAARPGVAWGFLRPAGNEGAWREPAAEQLRGQLEELTGRRVRLDILEVPGPQDTGPENAGRLI